MADEVKKLNEEEGGAMMADLLDATQNALRYTMSMMEEFQKKHAGKFGGGEDVLSPAGGTAVVLAMGLGALIAAGVDQNGKPYKDQGEEGLVQGMLLYLSWAKLGYDRTVVTTGQKDDVALIVTGPTNKNVVH